MGSNVAAIAIEADGPDESHHVASEAAVHVPASVNRIQVGEADNTAEGEIDRNNHNRHVCQLAREACDAMEKDDDCELYSVLGFGMDDDGDDATAAAAAASSTNKCHQLMTVFLSLIGLLEDDDDENERHYNGDGGELLGTIPLAVRAHLLLRALLRIRRRRRHDDKCSMLSWKAAGAAIRSLQYSSTHNRNNHDRPEKSVLSQREELAMVAEICSFVTSMRRSHNQMERGGPISSQQITQLTELGLLILAPFRRKSTVGEPGEGERGSDLRANNAGRTLRRRHNSYVLPLELIPAILATVDSLDDMQIHFKRVDGETISTKLKDDSTEMGDLASSPSEIMNLEETGPVRVLGSDKLLSTMFASYISGANCNFGTFHRTMRADASLHLISSAMDDIGSRRMSATLPADEDVTYWDCLKFALNDVIRANLVCYYDDCGSMMEIAGDARQQIINEAISDEGSHIIPSSDYPALMRCIFRMVAMDSPSSVSSSLSWESLLLRLYHAAAVASSRTPLGSVHPRKMSGIADRLATLSTVESHVLLPSCTGASVSTIRNILEACNIECCQSCKQDATDWKRYKYYHDESVLPVWAVAGVVLIMMRARSSNLSHLSTAAVSGPRAVFRMATDMLRKSARDGNSENKNNPTYFGGDDEVGYALKVLLRLSGMGDGTCRACCDIIPNENAEKSAYEVLKYSYYTGSEKFSSRFSTSGNGEDSYEHHLGRQTLSSYSILVRASLNRGVVDKARKSQSIDSFSADTARTWIDAANMLLDESDCTPTNAKASSSIPDGTAMAIVIIIVVFFRVPSSQDDIVRSIYNRIASMASHNSQSIGKQSKESWFVLISTLAWSLAANDEERSAINVVQTKGDKRENVTSVLGPICNLLSKTALSRDQHPNAFLLSCNSETPRLSYWAMQKLAHALAPTPAGREVILDMAQKNIGVLSTSSPYSQNVSSFESHQTDPSSSNDAIYLAVDCLCVLIETCHPSSKSSTDDCGRRALGMLTTMIVSQCPLLSPSSRTVSHVSIDVLSWMLCKLNKSARLGKFTKWTSRRLLRACFVGLLAFTTIEESQFESYSSFFLPGNIFSVIYSSAVAVRNVANIQTDEATLPAHSVRFRARNDVPGMLSLVVSLYDDISKPDSNVHGTASKKSFFKSSALFKTHLLRILLSQPDREVESTVVDESVQSEIAQLFKEGHNALQRGFNPNHESIDFLIDDVTLIILVEAAAKIIRTRRPETIDSDKLEQLGEYIYHSERYWYLQEGNGSPLPSWIDAPIHGSKRSHESIPQLDITLLTTCTEFKLFHASMVDILVEILLRNWKHDDQAEFVSCHHELPVLLGVNSILECKRRITNSIARSSAPELLLGEMSHNCWVKCLELTSQHLGPLLRSENKDAALAELDMLLKNILEICIQCQQTLQGGKSSRSRVLSSFWSLYCSLADEESSQLIALFVKESYVNLGKWEDKRAISDLSDSSFSLLSIESSDDLDYHVRYLRCEFLLALSQVLTLITTSQTVTSSEERKSSLDLLLQMLPHICQDLDAAFQGFSGGIERSLFLYFLGAIDKCIGAISALFESLPDALKHQISSFTSVHQAAEILWAVLRENALLQSSTVKGALKLCIDKMPIMILRAERVFGECIVPRAPSEHTCEVLDECISYLMSKPVIKESKEKASKSGTAAGSNESVNIIRAGGGNVTDNSSLNLVQEAENSEDKGSMDRKSNASPEIAVEGANMPYIARIETLAWSYNCVFAAMTNIWNDSYHILIARSGRMRKRSVKIPTEKNVALSLRRIEGFSRLHTSMCRLFEAKMGPDYEQINDSCNPTKILAELLSYHGKSNLCSCVEKMSMTLSLSVKQVIKYLEESSSQTPFNEIKLNESMTCIQGWLQSIKTRDTKHNLVTGILQWYLNEKRNFNLTFEENTYPILGRLPKVILRLEGLEAELQKLGVICAELNWRNDCIPRERLAVLNPVMPVSVKEKNDPEEENNFEAMLQQCIEIIDSCKNAMKIRNFLSDEDESDADLERLTGKRAKQRLAPMRKSRRVLLRSRNETIDNWLTLDDGEFGSTPGERYNVDDAFVDLEDFLVEG